MPIHQKVDQMQKYLKLFDGLGKNQVFFIKKEPACCKCGQVSPLEDLVVPSPLPITFTVAESVYGHIPDAVSASLMHYKCKGCKESKVENILLPEFLMLEIGLVNYRNGQDPPILIPEEFHLCEDLSYKLVGAVLFFCIVKVDNRYVVLDDLKDKPVSYQCFSGAITNDFQVLQDHHFTSPIHDGIHILLYASKMGELPQGHTLTVLERGNSFQHTCKSQEVKSPITETKKQENCQHWCQTERGSTVLHDEDPVNYQSQILVPDMSTPQTRKEGIYQFSTHKSRNSGDCQPEILVS